MLTHVLVKGHGTHMHTPAPSSQDQTQGSSARLYMCSDGKQKSFMNSSLTSFIVFKYFFYVVLLATFFFKGFASENLQEMVTFSRANILILVARQGFTFMPSSPPAPTPGTLSDKTQT